MMTTRQVKTCLAALCVLVLAACSSRPPAPVVERSTQPPRAEIPVDGLYRVRSGDTLHGIAFKYGLDYRDIAQWNSIRSPYTIFPDQALRLTEPPRRSSAVTTQAAPPPTTSTRQADPTPRSQTRPAPVPATPAPQPEASAPTQTVTPPPSQATAGSTDWIWPTKGRLLRTYKQGDPLRNGVDIVGTAGQPVQAAASGQVVYSGNGLIGYGELIIVKHNERMLSAYAHNSRRLVKEGDSVQQGQVIAEMGRNASDEQLLHFEIRRDGDPVNPLNYLPKQ